MNNYTGRDNLEVMKDARNYNAYLLRLIRSFADNGKDIVDFGAGAGTFAIPLVREGFNIVCVEPDVVLAASLQESGLSVVSTLDDVQDASVDYLYSLNVLEHIEDDTTVIGNWHRKLHPGGRLMVYVPAFQILYTSMDRKVGHFRRYRLGELRAKLQEAGFAVDNARYVDSIGFLASLAFRMLDNGSGDINLRALRIYDRYVFPLSCGCDRFMSKLGGKNLFIVAERPIQSGQ